MSDQFVFFFLLGNKSSLSVGYFSTSYKRDGEKRRIKVSGKKLKIKLNFEHLPIF